MEGEIEDGMEEGMGNWVQEAIGKAMEEVIDEWMEEGMKEWMEEANKEWEEEWMGEEMEEGMEEGMEGEWRKGWMKGWRKAWPKGWRDGGREGGLNPEEELGLKAEVVDNDPMVESLPRKKKQYFEGFLEGCFEGWRQGCLEAGTEGGMEAGMLEGGMGKGWREGWKEGWKDGYKLSWMNSKDEGNYSERDGGRDGGMGWRAGWTEGFRNGYKEGWLQGGIVEMMDGGMEEWKDFECDIDKLETEMELIHFIKQIIYHLPSKTFLSNGRYLECTLHNVKISVNYVEVFLPTTTFRVQSDEDRGRVFNDLVSLARLVMNFIREVARSSGKKFPRLEGYNFREKWIKIVDSLADIHCMCEKWDSDREKRRQSMSNVIDAVGNPLYDGKNITPRLELPEKPLDVELCNEEFLLLKAFPALGELGESSEMVNFLMEVTDELHEPIKKICELCEGSSLAVLLVGSLLSFKQPDPYAWGEVHKDLAKLRDNYYPPVSDYIKEIFTYCIGDLSAYLQLCFQYSVRYPTGSEIPAARLTEIWIADGLVKPEKGETLEDTANKYLEEFVQRSLVWVSMRSSSGRIKYFQIPRVIHEVALCLTQETSVNFGINRVAILADNNDQHIEEKYNHLRCFLASALDRDVLGTCPYLRVLELRNSTIRDTTLSKLYYLQYLGLRGCNISTLPENIENMKYLQTLDVRDTSVKTLPKSLWNILALRHVYTNPRSQIQGPPPTAILPNLQTLKTVVVPESWLENFPHSLINLRKLALSNMDNPTCKPNPYWESISKMLSRVDNLLSMTITGDIVPAEFADTRAFRNLETVKSIRLEGKWNYFKLTIDNTEFPPYLVKLTLTKSGLKEDPMPRLERLKALKYLSLKDGAYMGKKMVCSANGFPQLDFLELSELKSLEIWDVNPKAMPQLTKLRVVKCYKLDNLPMRVVKFCKLDNLPILKDVDKELIEMQPPLSLFLV